MYDLNKIPYNYTVEVTNRFKGLDLIDTVPEELWSEVCNILQEAVIKTILKKKKCKKAKWLPEEAMQLAKKRRDAKSKGEKEKYDHQNAEFQRIARRNKEALSEQCSQLWECNRLKRQTCFSDGKLEIMVTCRIWEGENYGQFSGY